VGPLNLKSPGLVQPVRGVHPDYAFAAFAIQILG
jgi:hypothetical protein